MSSPAPPEAVRTAPLRRALAVAVGLVLADSSVVVLALPEIYRELDVSVTAVTWVLVAFNLVARAGGGAGCGRRVAASARAGSRSRGSLCFAAGQPRLRPRPDRSAC